MYARYDSAIEGKRREQPVIFYKQRTLSNGTYRKACDSSPINSVCQTYTVNKFDFNYIDSFDLYHNTSLSVNNYREFLIFPRKTHAIWKNLENF